MEQPLPTVLVPGPSAPADWSQVPAPAPLPPTSFGIGSLLSRSVSLWVRSLHLFAPLGMAAYAPLAAGMYLVYARLLSAELRSPSTAARAFLAFGGAWLLTMVLSVLLMGAVSHGALRRLEGQPLALGGALAAGLRRWPALLALSILVGLAVLACCLPIVVGAALGARAAPYLAFLGMLAGLAVSAVPMVWLLCGWSAAVPAAVAERAGPLRALSRSWDLTRGHRWQVFGGFVVLFLLTMALAYLVQFALMMPLVVASGYRNADHGTALALPMALSQLVGGALSPLPLVASAVTYHGLRAIKEGGDPEHLGRVFE
jgi:hypothetical protein